MLFDFVKESHPFHPAVTAFRAQAEARIPMLDRLQQPDRSTPTIHAEIKAIRAQDGGWHLDRFYWSYQATDPAARFGVRAATLTFAAKDPEAVWQIFPADTYLAHIAGYAATSTHDARTRLLRYVPLRRATFDVRHPEHGRVIGKFKRRSRFRDAYRMLELVAAAARHAKASFRVAAPRGIVEAQHLYFQEALAGENVAELIDANSAPRLMSRIGELHHALHRLDGSDLTPISNAVWLRRASDDFAQIGLYFPEARERLAHLPALLTRLVPSDTGFVLCHGDFVCSQLLLAGDRWSITDFDLACSADPCRDVAMLVASLPYDVPFAAEDPTGQRTDVLAAAYLEGYSAVARQSVDAQRLLWHRIVAEIYYLALMLKKDRFDQSWFETRVTRAIGLGDRLAHA